MFVKTLNIKDICLNNFHIIFFFNPFVYNINGINGYFVKNSDDSLCIVEGAAKNVSFIVNHLKPLIRLDKKGIIVSFHNSDSGVKETLEEIGNNLISHSTKLGAEIGRSFFKNLLQSDSKEAFKTAYDAYFQHFIPKNELDDKLQQLYNLYYNENTPIEKIKTERSRLLNL